MKRLRYLLLAGLVACGGGSDVLAPDSVVDIGLAMDAAVTDSGEKDSSNAPDTTPKEDIATDTGAAGCEPGTGCFDEPCDGPDDCNSSICTHHMGEKVCTKTCDADCPNGWTCTLVTNGSDGQYVCTSNYADLCLPCTDSGDCATDTATACVVYPDGLSFCAGACDLQNPCPGGYDCQEVETTSGGTSYQCVAETGICECSSLAIASSLGTPCSHQNEYGTCEGMRICTDAGLAECNADTAMAETCNGVDDNCDGDIDEDTCDDGNPCTEDLCGGAEGCNHTPLDKGECLDNNACTQADHCEQGQCVGNPLTCDDDNACTDDTCDPETGCQTALNFADCDDGDACTIGDSCKEGACASGNALTCDDGNPCTDDGCGEDGCTFTPNQNACDDDNVCTQSASCSEGSCLGADPTPCNDDNPCTDDGCDPAAGCTETPNTAPCDDGSVCTLGDVCADGSCTAGANPLACDDGNPCTDESCDPATGCAFSQNAAKCDDGNACTVDDTCVNGACLAGGGGSCDDGNICTDDSCDPAVGCNHTPNVVGCDDGDACTTSDVCAQGSCLGGDAPNCEDGNPCTDDGCAPGSGCFNTDNELACNDGDACTAVDACVNGACVGADALDCDDANPCTDATCDAVAGCQHTNNSAPCDDGNACTESDTCTGGGCVSGQAPTCDDGDLCTDDGCDPEIGCTHTNNAAPCDDGDACSISDGCSNGLCIGGGAKNCDDGNPCTDDGCDPNSGCITSNNANGCDDGSPCTLSDSCEGGACVGAQSPCQNGGSCAPQGADYSCQCPGGWAGKNCDEEAACGGWAWNGACWYTSPSTGWTCNQLCDSHCGFDVEGSKHQGNQAGMHFWPGKANGNSNWSSIECSSTDNNTNWPANGETPDGGWSHNACYVNCACNC